MFQDSSSLMKKNMVPTHIQFHGGHSLIDLVMHVKMQLHRSNSYWHIPQIRTVFQKYKKICWFTFNIFYVNNEGFTRYSTVQKYMTF